MTRAGLSCAEPRYRRRIRALPFITAALIAAPIALTFASPALATPPTLFGPGARSAGLARADIASADALDAPVQNPALAAEPGVRLRVGYGYASMSGLSINDQSAGIPNASGFTFAAQLGVTLSDLVAFGVGLAASIPDQSLARLSFRPATEPQFVLYESSLQRTTFDLIAAARYRSLWIGGGVSLGVAVGGKGTQFDLKQDAAGTRADAVADVALPYRAAPVGGVRLGLGRLLLGFSFRGPSAIDLSIESRSLVALTDNPLNGITTVKVTGTSGFDPATLDFAASFEIGHGFSVHSALEVALYSAAPPPVADVSIDVDLGTIPSQREAHFIEPRFRNTLSPRIGFEFKRPMAAPASVPVSKSAPVSESASAPESESESESVSAPEPASEPAPASASSPVSASDWRWAVRLGYVLAPSPVPRQTGFTTYADATRHGLSIGGGYHFGDVLGVDIAANLAAELHILAPRHEEKTITSLPYARYDVAGHIFYGVATLEAAWR